MQPPKLDEALSDMVYVALQVKQAADDRWTCHGNRGFGGWRLCCHPMSAAHTLRHLHLSGSLTTSYQCAGSTVVRGAE